MLSNVLAFFRILGNFLSSEHAQPFFCFNLLILTVFLVFQIHFFSYTILRVFYKQQIFFYVSDFLLLQLFGGLRLSCGLLVALPVIGGILVILGVVFIVLAVKKSDSVTAA